MIKEEIGYKESNLGFGANGLDDVAFEKLFDNEFGNTKHQSGVTDFDFVNKMWNEAIENGQKKRRKRSTSRKKVARLNSTNSFL